MQWNTFFMNKSGMFSFFLLNTDMNTSIFNLTTSSICIAFNPKYISDFLCFYNDDMNL